MHDFRFSTALCQLVDLGHDPGPPRWVWAIARLDRDRRIRLPDVTRPVLGVEPGRHREVWGVCHRSTLVVSVNGDHDGRRMTIDGRGRLCIPAWLCRGEVTAMLIGTRDADGLVLIGPTQLLDGVGDTLTGVRR